MAPHWNIEEDEHLLACIDYCVDHNLALKDNLPALHNEKVERKWNGIKGRLAKIVERWHSEEVDAVELLEKQGSGALDSVPTESINNIGDVRAEFDEDEEDQEEVDGEDEMVEGESGLEHEMTDVEAIDDEVLDMDEQQNANTKPGSRKRKNEGSLGGAEKKKPRSGYESAELFDEVEVPLFEDERDAEITILQEQVAALTKQVSETERARTRIRAAETKVEEVEEMSRVYRDVHRQEIEDLRKNFEEEADRRIRISELCKQSVKDLTERGLMKAQLPVSFPPKYRIEEMQGRWPQAWADLRGFTPTIKMHPKQTKLPDIGLPADWERLFCRVVGIPFPKAAGSVSISDVFREAGVSKPSSHDVVNALFLARVWQWCTDTAYHTGYHRVERAKMIFETMAEYGGLRKVREFDTLCTVRRIRGTAYKMIDIPRIAGEQAAEFVEEFADYTRPNDASIKERFPRSLTDTMRLKDEILIDARAHNTFYVPPGTLFDGRSMEVAPEAENSLKQASQYRVVLCVWPGLVSMPEAEFSEEPVDGHEYVSALLESRTWVHKDPTQWRAWEGDSKGQVMGRAVVIVEEIGETNELGEVDELEEVAEMQEVEEAGDFEDDED